MQYKSIWHISSTFQVNAGVRQGSVLFPLLFVIVIDWAVREATQERIFGIQLDDMTFSDLDFADDVCLVEDDFNAALGLLSSVIAAAAITGLIINVEFFSNHAPENLKCGDDVVENCHFNYLGSTITDNKEINNRIAKATVNSKRLSNFWKSNNISTNLKAKLHQTCVRGTLPYGSESWNLKKSDIKALDVFENKCARRFVSRSYMQQNSYIHANGKLSLSIEIVIQKSFPRTTSEFQKGPS